MTTNFSDPKIQTKRWLRKVIMGAVQTWAPIFRLESLVDTISVFIGEPNDKGIGKNAGACITVDSTRRTADIRVKRNVVSEMQGEYCDTEYTPEDVVEMTIMHELLHIVMNPMSQWAYSTIEGMRNRSILENLFSQQEEVCVEHLTRVFQKIKQDIPVMGKFKGNIKYLSKDPTNPVKELKLVAAATKRGK